MMKRLTPASMRSIGCFGILAAACIVASWAPAAFSQDKNGCEGVQFSKRPFAQYSPEKLRQRIQQDPSDVDALVNLGIHLEEQDQIAEAKAVYERAIKAKPGCYLGYYFAGLAAERISTESTVDADVKVHQAISLDPSLPNDPNVQGFLKRHAHPVPSALPMEKYQPSLTKQILVARFYIGVAVGIFLSVLVFYLVRLRQAPPKGA